jgi:aspartate ammonia-lyase
MNSTVAKRRTESDRFGELELQADALWGIQTARSIENLSFSGKPLSSYVEFIQSLAQVKRAAAAVNHEIGLIDDQTAEAIIYACDELIAGNFCDQFPVDMLHGGGGIAFNMNVNEVISNLANQYVGSEVGRYKPVEIKMHINASQSTADVCHTAFRLTVLKMHAKLDRNLGFMIEVLDEQATKLLPVKTIARTCLQDAMPVSLGELFGAYAALVRRRRLELGQAISSIKAINLGGTVIGCGHSASDEYRGLIVSTLSKLTGSELRHRDNLFDAAENVDDLAQVSTQLEHLAQALLKIARDLRLLSSGPQTGFSELILPRVQEGSSFFSAKNNPVVPETVMSCCFQVFGLNRTTQAAIEHAELYLNVFESVAATSIFDAIKMLGETVEQFTNRCLSQLEANVDRCALYASLAASNNEERLKE